MNSDLAKAKSALAAGRPEEARIYAWSAAAMVQPEEVAELAAVARALDDPKLLLELELRGGLQPGPVPPIRRKRRRRRRLRLLARHLPAIVVVSAVVVLAVLDYAGAEPGSREPTRDDAVSPTRLSRSLLVEQSGVWLVPVGEPTRVDLPRLAEELTLRYRLPVGTLPGVALPPWTLDEGKKRLVSQRLIALVQQTYGARGRAVVIGVTDFDMYDEVEHLEHEFSLRAAPHYGVVSTSDLGASLLERWDGHSRHERTRKLLARIIGFTYFGRSVVDDPHSLLRSQMNSIGDIDELEEDL
jgi:hypothetical protein